MSPCAVTAPEVITKQPSEVRQYAMDFTNLLSGVEVISSITSVVDTLRGGGTSDLTVYNEVVSEDGLSVVFWVSGGTANNTYRIEIAVVTTAAQSLEGDGLMSVRSK